MFSLFNPNYIINDCQTNLLIRVNKGDIIKLFKKGGIMTLRHPSLKFYGLVYAWYVKLNNQFANFIFNHFLLFQHFVENPKGLSKVFY